MNLYRKLLLMLIFLTFAISSAFAGQVEETIVTKLVAEYGLDSGQYEIEILANRLDVTTLTTNELSFKPISNKEPLGLFTVLAAVTRDGITISKGQVRVRIKKYEEVYVVTDKIKRHDPITETKLILKRMEVTSLLQQPIRDLGELDSYRARLIIRRDQILTTNLIELVPDIEVGHEVTIILKSHLLQITAPGRVLESGNSGDIIRVKNKATGKTVMARVIDRNSVAVDI